MPGRVDQFVCLLFVTVIISLRQCYGVNYIGLQTPADCKKGPNDNNHEFFDISQLRCTPCAQTSQIQTVSKDGLRCICKPGMKLTKNFGGGTIECEECPANQATSEDLWNCVACDSNYRFNPNSRKCESCLETDIRLERDLTGNWFSGTPTRSCATCTTSTKPDAAGRRCERCNQILSVIPGQTDCTCPESNWVGGVCFSSDNDVIPDSEDLYRVDFDGTKIRSQFFVDNIRAAYGMCQTQYANLTACQVLGNLCVLMVYDETGATTSRVTNACEGYKVLAGATSGLLRNDQRAADTDWPANMPWLYYQESSSDSILTDSRISTKYKFPNDELLMRAAIYTANGSYLGLKPLTGGLIQLCKSSEAVMDAAYLFGTSFQQTCEISVRNFFDVNQYPVRFFDLYLEYAEENVQELYAVPVRITNMKDNEDGSPMRDWQLVRRFLLVDNLSGKQSAGASDDPASQLPSYVRYAQSMRLVINLQENTREGQIYPPYLEITYATASRTDYTEDKKVQVSFSVSYSMNLEKYNEDIRIAMGVMCALACVYSFVQTWAWSKRTGKIAIDFLSIMKFILFCINNVANVFFVVCFGASIWWLIFYKRQESVYLLLPTRDQEVSFITYISIAFCLKFIHMIHFLIAQVTVDIFFVDWERPRGRNDQGDKGNQDIPVSIWRTYFVANEWNEIQTCRKINNILQLFVVIFFLSFLGFENIATADPHGSLSRREDRYYAPDSRIFRFALAALIYLLSAVAQWIFFTVIYERFIEDKVQQYVDLCSLSNISVFILENAQFGYYIHGRSVHGRADTDMREMHINLKREEEDLCGQRGLMPNTEQQTFQISIPRKLREHYERVMLPITQPQQGAQVVGGRGTGAAQGMDPNTEKILDGYKVLNSLLQKFIDHSLKNIDYMIKDKLLFEGILGMEFQSGTEKGFFYNDNGHSFDSVLFYGNEETLTLFEILVFTVSDLIASNYILAAVITYIFMEILTTIRDSLGRNNLAKKTLVDKRFLI